MDSGWSDRASRQHEHGRGDSSWRIAAHVSRDGSDAQRIQSFAEGSDALAADMDYAGSQGTEAGVRATGIPGPGLARQVSSRGRAGSAGVDSPGCGPFHYAAG